MTFHNVKIPKFIEVFARGGPVFSTSCAITSSGREIRRSDRYEAKQKYLIKNCRLSPHQFAEFNAFFRARAGQNYSFRFKDYADFKVENQVIKSLSSNEKDVVLFKLYEDQVAPYKRFITKPIKSSIKLYFANNVIIPEYVDENRGIVTLKSPIPKEELWMIDFEFDVAVRFSSDSFEYNYRPDGSIELCNLELMEVDE